MIYYIADMHLNDQLIFDKCKKPFKDILEYKEQIVSRWNNKVKDDDTVYVLGDISDETRSDCLHVFKILNGHKHLIIGNHDSAIMNEIEKLNLFETINFIKLIDDNGRKVCLCHYPIMDWIEFNRGGMLVYGHIHNKTSLNNKAYADIKKYYEDKPAYNCGVDVVKYEPVTLDEMIRLKEEHKNDPYIY